MKEFKVYCRDCNGQFADITSIVRIEKRLEEVRLPAVERLDFENPSYPKTGIIFSNLQGTLSL